MSVFPRAALLALPLALLACTSDDAPASDPGALVGDEAPPDLGDDGIVSRDAALVAWARVFGPLPGGPGAGPDHARRTSGTGPMRWVLGHWRELDQAQRDAVLAVVAGPSVTVGGAPRSLTVATRRSASGVSIQSLADAKTMLDTVVADVGTRLGRTLKAKIVLATTSVDYSGTAFTFPFNADGQNPFAGGAPPPKSERPTYGEMAECRITLTPDGLALAATAPGLRASLQHEVFHCFMIDLLGIDAFLDRSPWLVEGAAAWVGESAVGGTTLSKKWWAGWLTQPRTTLFARSYDAIGLYALIDARGKNPWAAFDEMYKAPTNVGAYAVAAEHGGDDFVDSWPASYVREPSFGVEWEATGPGITSDRATFAPTVLGAGAEAHVAAPPQVSDVMVLDVGAEVVAVDVSSLDGSTHGLMHTADGTTWPLTSDTYCTKAGGCECPPGSAFDGTFRALAPGRIHLAVAGHLAGARVDARGSTLDDFCAKPGKPGSSIAITGATAQTVSVRGSCSVDKIGGGDVFRLVFSFTGTPPIPIATENNRLLLDVTVDPYAGPTAYEAGADTSSAPAHIFLSGGLGQSWSVYTRQSSALTIAPDGHSGSINVEMRDKADGTSVVRADGAWTCDDSL